MTDNDGFMNVFIDNCNRIKNEYIKVIPIAYIITETLVASMAIIGNLLAILVFIKNKKFHEKYSNFYILSLSVADLMVGTFGIPSAILTRMGRPFNNFYLCLTMLSLLIIFCTVSILNLVAVSLDRYWSIYYPINHRTNMTSKALWYIIATCWFAGILIGLLPLMGWNKFCENNKYCIFTQVMRDSYLVFIFAGTIAFPSFIMLFCYARIYLLVVRKASEDASRNIPLDQWFKCSGRKKFFKTSVSTIDRCHKDNQNSLRTNYRFTKSKRKEVRNLAIIVLFFMICWFPLYLINTLKAFQLFINEAHILVDSLIVISHLNSAINPILYAYHIKDFPEAMKLLFLQCITLKSNDSLSSVKLHSKKLPSTAMLPMNSMRHNVSFSSRYQMHELDFG